MPTDVLTHEAGDGAACTTTATPPIPFDALVSEWVLGSSTLSHQQKQSLLSEELRALNFYAKSARTEPSSSTTTTTTQDQPSLVERRAALVAAMKASTADPDTAALRDGAELLTVSTDLDGLYDLLDPGCVMDLSFAGTTVHAAATGVDAVVDELCEQQESILGCRGDLAARRSGTTATSTSRHRSSGGGVVRAVSEVTSWISTTTAQPSPQVGTYITYFADTEKAVPVFSLHTICTFAVDGRTVERVARTLISHDAYNGEAVLKEIHFGSFRSPQ